METCLVTGHSLCCPGTSYVLGDPFLPHTNETVSGAAACTQVPPHTSQAVHTHSFCPAVRETLGVHALCWLGFIFLFSGAFRKVIECVRVCVHSQSSAGLHHWVTCPCVLTWRFNIRQTQTLAWCLRSASPTPPLPTPRLAVISSALHLPPKLFSPFFWGHFLLFCPSVACRQMKCARCVALSLTGSLLILFSAERFSLHKHFHGIVMSTGVRVMLNTYNSGCIPKGII